jgi:peptide/nickel transport system substrate-binding protein
MMILEGDRPMNVRRLGALAAALALATSITACGGGSSAKNASKTLTLAAALDNNSFDPTQLNIGNQMQYWSPVFDTLLVRDKDNQITPGLATKWEYDAKRTVLTLTLRSGVTFTDGTPFDGEAVKANLENLAAGTGQNAYMAKPVERVEVVSPTVVKLHLKEPDPGMVDYLSMVGGAMASPKSLKSKDVATTPVGSGPYVLDKTSTVTGSTYTYTRNPKYWDASSFPYDKVVIKPMTDITARLNAIKSGQVNGAIAETANIKDAKASNLTVNTSAVNWVGLLIVDRDGKQVPALKSLQVRQAMNYAFDAEGILKNVSQGEGKRTTQIFNSVGDAYDPELDSAYGYDVAKAKQLMADAGYAAGFDLKMPEIAGFARYNAIIEQQLGALNIRVTWVKVPANSTIPEVLSGKYPAFFFTLGSQSPWQDIRKAVAPNAPWNPLKVQRPELDTLLHDAQYADENAQPAAMKAVSRYLVDNAWFAPWYRENAVYLTDAKTSVSMEAYNVAPSLRMYAPKAG